MKTEPAPTSSRTSEPPAGAMKPVAVIDIGSTSIRVAIAQIDADGRVAPLETLSHPVNLGKDTFTRGSIEKSTVEECVRILRNYVNVLREYGVDGSERTRVVATTAVREAVNSQSFLDRVLVATGLRVEPIDEAEATRLTYLGVRSVLASDPTLGDARALVVEIGGGSTELLMLKGEQVEFSRSYRLGSLRLRKMLETYRAPVTIASAIIDGQIRRTIEQIRRDIPHDGPSELVTLGGDVRFAATQILGADDTAAIRTLRVDDVERLARHMLETPVDELVQRYPLTFPDAESVGPALLANTELARAFELDHIHLTSTTLRDGLLQEMAVGGAWTEAFREQIIRSAIDLGRRYGFNEAHGRHTAELSRTLFQELQAEHQLDHRYELILYIAALLHDVGNVVNNRSHHKHSMYLIENSDLFGLGRQDMLLVALVARYHRRAAPRSAHEGYAALTPESRIAVAKMAALLRVADALDRSDSQRIKNLTCQKQGDRLVIQIQNVEDVSLEQLALKQKGSLFDDIFGMTVLLRRG
ncbi:MAG: Ppx/GppA family phosphatase [Planctomycetes bacterium]|nr:Ppx/GppA family phosphatase [Planctomycetota bacterium]